MSKFTPIKLVALGLPQKIQDPAVQDFCTNAKILLETRILGLHGDQDTVVLKGQLGLTADITVVVGVRNNSGTYQKQTQLLGFVDGILVNTGTVSGWTNL